jgi:mevalonate kinase
MIVSARDRNSVFSVSSNNVSEKQFPKLISVKPPLLPKEVQASACGKAIIVGEHAVVYGTHAIAMPLRSMRFQFALTPIPHVEGKPVQLHLKLAGHDVSPRVQSVVLEAMELLGHQAFSIQAKSSSALPIGAGLGSSATLCVAVLRALSTSLDIVLGKSDLARLANELEKRFHGNPSGLDAAVVAFEQCILFAKHQTIRGSNVRASTMAMIRIAEPYFLGVQGDRRLQQFDALALSVHEALQSGDTTTVGRAMTECGSWLREAGVVPDNLQAMIDQTRELGVLGAKTTGAGGGGVILALLDPREADAQYQAIKACFRNYPVYRASLEAE